MKWMKRYPLLLMLMVSGIVLAGTGLAGKQGIYKDYTYDGWKMPLSSLVFLGLHDGILPGIEQEGGPVIAEGLLMEKSLDGDAMNENGKEGVSAAEDGANGDLNGNLNEDSNAQGALSEKNAQDRDKGALAEEKERTYTFEKVTEEYFDDALFIGDSRTVGLQDYAGMEGRATFYCKTSLTIWDVLEKPIVKEEGQKQLLTVEEALTQNQFGKIYLMVGINELGRGNTELFMEQYAKVVNRIRELQPDAIIFVEGIMRVAGKKNASDAIFNNTNINEKNERIRELADNKDIFYIDVNEVVCDEEGNLNADYTSDEVHLKAVYYQIWKEFLLEHGIVREESNAKEQEGGAS